MTAAPPMTPAGRPADKRYLTLWLPRLAIDRLNRMAPGGRPLAHPLALTRRAQNRVSLVAVNDAAEDQGLTPGMVLATARAICSTLDVRDHDAAADQQVLERLANWADRYSPSLAVDGSDGLVLDITGCAHLFGGEAALLKDAARRLRRFGFAARGAIADTPGAAWALSRFAHDLAIAPAGGSRQVLAPLPVEALRLDAGTAQGLQLMGLKTLGDLWALPRAALASRYGLELARRLDQVLGLSPDPIKARAYKKPLREELRFAEPIATRGAIDRALNVLLERLCRHLEATGQGCRRLLLHSIRADNTSQHLQIGTASPNRTAAHLFHLFSEKLGRLEPGHGIDVLQLSAPVVEPFNPRQDDISLHLRRPDNASGAAMAAASPELSGPSERSAGKLAALIDTLENRLGDNTVGLLRPVASHLPERAQRWQPACEIADRNRNRHWPPVPARPLHLLKSPEILYPGPQDGADPAATDRPPARLHCRGRDHQVRRVWGPERIAANWWRPDPQWKNGARDYYRIQVDSGEQFWIYREAGHNQQRWYLHGLFA